MSLASSSRHSHCNWKNNKNGKMIQMTQYIIVHLRSVCVCVRVRACVCASSTTSCVEPSVCRPLIMCCVLFRTRNRRQCRGVFTVSGTHVPRRFTPPSIRPSPSARSVQSLGLNHLSPSLESTLGTLCQPPVVFRSPIPAPDHA